MADGTSESPAYIVVKQNVDYNERAGTGFASGILLA
jgi:hypothetical protein